MSLFKRLSRRPGVRRAAARLISRYLRLVHDTTRWTFVGEENLDRLHRSGKPVISAFWHGRLAMMAFAWRSSRPFGMLVSEHRDGQFIGDVIEPLGIARISGSTTRGGAKAFRTLVQTVKSGQSVGLTPDGPRGPRMRVQAGVVQLARLAGAPLLPACHAIRPRIALKTWDGFVMPLPFGRGVFIWGEPVEIARGADAETVEAARLALEDRMNAQVEQADRMLDLEPIRPLPGPA